MCETHIWPGPWQEQCHMAIFVRKEEDLMVGQDVTQSVTTLTDIRKKTNSCYNIDCNILREKDPVPYFFFFMKKLCVCLFAYN